METHLTQIQGSVLYRRANYSPSGLHICVSFLERTSPDNFFTTIAALSKERMTHLCEEITNLPFHPRQVPLLQDRRPYCTNLLRSTKVDETKNQLASSWQIRDFYSFVFLLSGCAYLFKCFLYFPDSLKDLPFFFFFLNRLPSATEEALQSHIFRPFEIYHLLVREPCTIEPAPGGVIKILFKIISFFNITPSAVGRMLFKALHPLVRIFF